MSIHESVRVRRLLLRAARAFSKTVDALDDYTATDRDDLLPLAQAEEQLLKAAVAYAASAK